MSIRSHYLTETERALVSDALYHEGLGALNRCEYVANVPHLIGSPGEPERVFAVVEAVLTGQYRGDLVECGKADCYCRI